MSNELSAFQELFTNGILWPAEAGNKISIKPPIKRNIAGELQICPEDSLENILYDHCRDEHFLRYMPFDDSAASKSVSFGVNELDCQLPHKGLAYGAIHEWFYAASSGVNNSYPLSIISLLIGNRIKKDLEKKSPAKLIVWIGKDSWPTPHLLQQALPKNFSFSKNCLFVDIKNPKTKNWCIETALASPAVAAVVAECSKVTLGYTRRFALAARKSNALGFLLRPKEDIKFLTTAVSRWQVTPLPSQNFNSAWNLELIKIKGKRPSVNSWRIEIREEVGDEKISLHTLSNVGNKSRSKKNDQAKSSESADHINEQKQEPVRRKALL